MTTIAWDGVSLAADTQLSSADTIVGSTEKIIKLKANLWIATTGYHSETGIFKEWVLHGQPQNDKPKISEEFAAFILTSKGLFEYDFLLYPMEVTNKCAIGSGSDWAIAAMDFQCNAAAAVRYASQRDVYTNSIIQIVKASKRG